MPNVYVYAANNPSESILAKRRGYGTIISHNVSQLHARNIINNNNQQPEVSLLVTPPRGALNFRLCFIA